jgi:hypothetical protein
MGSLKERLRHSQHEDMYYDSVVQHQDDLERRLKRPVDAGDRQMAGIGGK